LPANASSWSITSLIARVVSDPSVRGSFVAYAVTRGVILLVFVLTAQLDVPPAGSNDPWKQTSLNVRHIAFYRLVDQRVSTADVNWYMGIAQSGYERLPFNTDTFRNWAFFPLFPLVWRALAKITGEYVLTGSLLSCLCFFPALILVHKIALAYGLETKAANRAVLYLAAFPVSYFFMIPVTESLFLLLITGSFFAAKREHWWLAGILGALASATRVTGVLLLPTLIVLYWETYGRQRPRLNAIWILLVPAGLLAYMYFLYTLTGNPLAFKDINVLWGRQLTFVLWPLIYYLKQPLLLASAWDFRVLNFTALMVAIGAVVLLIKWRWWSMACFTLCSLFVMLSSGVLQSQARYVMVLFPVFIVLGRVCRDIRFHQAVLTASLILLCLTTVLFCYGITFTLS
jgi:hypothetical protein